ncbi:uncharacterized protein [Aegilops tauschii subsp. strangulata]|nr:uncharacterized protein LOC109787004 [Aegilops tauschii subsp. strangulata]
MESADWSSLPADLVRRIADGFLATSDLDYYMDLRAVCHSWRTATDDPKGTPDPRFRPRHWVSIDSSRSNTHLLVNTATGRFLRKELPVLRDYFIDSTTPDGLLVLMDDKSPHSFSVLNSFTGYSLRFAAPQPDEFVDSAALVAGSSPAIILLFRKYIDDDDVRLRESPRRVYMAEPDSESYAVSEDRYACPLIRLAVRGIHTIGELGSVAPFPLAVARRIFNLMRFFNAEPVESDDEDTMMSEEESIWKFWIGYDNRCYLMESAGEILIIMKLKDGMEVYKMDTESYVLEHVDNIGSRAIFLSGYCRCMSVNADKFPSIDANCIYYIKSDDFSRDYIYMYNLKSRREERVSKDISCVSRPCTIIQLLSSLDLP